MSIVNSLTKSWKTLFLEERSLTTVVSIGSELVGCFGEIQTVQKMVQKRPFLKPIASFQRLDA